MQFTTFILLLATTVAAIVAEPPTEKLAYAIKKRDCKPNGIESWHLGHGHDINTGDVKVKEGTDGVKHLGLKPGGGSGCSPQEWEKIPAYSTSSYAAKGKGTPPSKEAGAAAAVRR